MSYGRNLYLNLGSGQRPFDKPWINVDIQEKWKPDIVADCSNLPMLEDNSACLIVLHHVLEHYGCNEADGLLKECRRLLSPTGSLIITVPDVISIVRGYWRGELDVFHVMVNLYGAYMGDEADRHKWGYTQLTLRKKLESLGFRSRAFDWRPIEGASIAQDWWILGEEAWK